MTSRLLSLFRIFAPRQTLNNPNSWRYIALWRQWIQDQGEQEQEQSEQCLMERILQLQCPSVYDETADPIQSVNAIQFRNDSLLEWRRMMQRLLEQSAAAVFSQPQQQPLLDSTPSQPSVESPSLMTQRRVPTTNHIIRSMPTSSSSQLDGNEDTSHVILAQ